MRTSLTTWLASLGTWLLVMSAGWGAPPAGAGGAEPVTTCSQCTGATDTAPPCCVVGPTAPPLADHTADDELPARVWGLVGLRGFAFGDEVAPNGVEFNPLFSLDLDLNFMVWREQKWYIFVDCRFWAQRPGAGVTNPSQGVFDFSKREFDLDLGTAWNYWGSLEARVFAYSYNNLNRGQWLNRPAGFNDGLGLENRFYFGPTYEDLGTQAFDVARANFLSVGYMPTKDLIDGIGMEFKPGLFAHAYVTMNVYDDLYYLYVDTQFIAARSMRPKLWETDGGLALRPFTAHPRLEFRLGSQDTYDCQWKGWEVSAYVAVRYIY
jgi:hypothetical protein